MKPNQLQLSKLLRLVKHPPVLLLAFVQLPIVNWMIKRRHWDGRSYALSRLNRKYFLLRVTDTEQYAFVLNTMARVWRIHDESCLARSVLLWVACTRNNQSADIIVGSENENPASFHAWVEVDGLVVNDRSDVRVLFQPFDQPYLSSLTNRP